MDDWTLLSAYIKHGDEHAFSVLVERHIGLVYSAALRQLNDAHATEEIVQAVFAALAQKAKRLRPGSSLAAWLYRSACGKAIDRIREDSARRKREQRYLDATMNDQIQSQEAEAIWNNIAPLLDEAMSSLREKDRTAILMRIFEERPFTEIGSALGISDDTARKRVTSALDKLRRWFERRDVRCSSAALGVVLTASAATAPSKYLLQTTIQSALASVPTAGGVGAASALTTSIIAMKLPIAIGLIAGAALPLSSGYLDSGEIRFAGAQSSAVQSLTESTNSYTTPEAGNGSANQSTQNALMAEWEELRHSYGPPLGTMEELYKAVADVEDDFRRRTYRTFLIAEWTETAPEEALAFFNATRDYYRVANVMSVWLRNAPMEALDAMENGGEIVRDQIDSVLDVIAEVAPSELARMASQVEIKKRDDTRIRDAFAIAARRDPEGMRQTAEAMTGESGGEALAGVALAWAERDPQSALEWAQSLNPGAGKSRALQGLLMGWAETDPTGALDHLHIAPPGGGQMKELHAETARRVFEAAAAKDFDGVLNWMSENPEAVASRDSFGLRTQLRARLQSDLNGTLNMVQNHPAGGQLQNVLGSILHGFSEAEIASVWDWAESSGSGHVSHDLKQQIFTAAAWRAPNLAAEWAGRVIDTGNFSAREVASRLMSNGRQGREFDELLTQVPETVRRELLNVGFEGARNQGREDEGVGVWMARLEQVHEQDRPQAISALASAQATYDPGTALEWADELPANERSHAYRGIVRTWAGSDSYEASRWISELGQSPERDTAVAALVDSILVSEPDSAWAWAETLGDPSLRNQTLRGVILRFGDSADAFLQTSNLSKPERAELRALVQDQSRDRENASSYNRMLPSAQ